MPSKANLSLPRTLAGFLVLLPGMLAPSASADATAPVEALAGGPLTVACGGTVYTRIFQSLHANSGSYFALYADATGMIAAKWRLQSDRVTTSNAAAGVQLAPATYDLDSPWVSPTSSGYGGLSFSTSDLAFYGGCVRPIGRLPPNAEYSGRLEGVVEQLKTTTKVECKIITDTRMSGGYLYLQIVGYGWIRATQTATTVCATSGTVEVEPHTLFRGAFTTSHIPGLGVMMCTNSGYATTCASSSATSGPAMEAWA